MSINIAGIDKAELLAALYNAAVPVGLGVLHFTPEPMPTEQAAGLIKERDRGNGRIYFDYLGGRPLKVDVGGDEMRTDLYDRDQGHGAAEAVVAKLRSTSA